MKEYYNQLVINQLPNDIIAVFAQIRKETADFKNKVMVQAHKKNFNRLMELVKLKFSKAIKIKEVIVEKSKKQLLESKITGFKVAMKFAKEEQKSKLKAKIKGFETALKFVK